MKTCRIVNRGAGTYISVILLVFALMVPACGGKKEVKQASRESKVSQEAFALAEAVRSAYARKEFSKIADLSTSDGYREVLGSIRHFDTVDLTFTPRWVEIEQSKVYLNMAWKGSWTVGKDTYNERGMAVLLLEGTPLKLVKIVRGNPFKYPETQ